MSEQPPDLQVRIARYLAWINSPQFEPCPRCQGKGYHHGFGEDGHDPDWCLHCGGPGEVPTEPGTWSPDDLLREAAEALREAASSRPPSPSPDLRFIERGDEATDATNDLRP